jgi:polyisoprenoid-binding protein YceI
LGQTGIASFAGHEHEVAARSFEGRVIADREDLSRSSVEVTFDASALKVIVQGEPVEDVPKVQAEMQGPKVLDAARFPTIRFR